MNLLAQQVVVTNGNDRGYLMGFVIWILIGLIAGFLASKVVNKRGDGLILDIILGLVGSVVGGFLFGLLGIGGNGSFIGSVVIATLGAILVLVIYHKVIRKGV